MKKYSVLLILLLAFRGVAQNLQVHYDMGEDREHVTTTLEMFKPDALGSTFWFVDMDYNSAQPNKSMSLGYWEIARYFTLPVLDKKLSATIQYNDGLLIGPAGTSYWGAPLNSVWLAGASYFIPVGKGNLNVDLLYRQMDVSDKPDAQFTLVWFYPFLNGKLHFVGFLDYWSQDMPGENGIEKKGVLLTEPQLWYTLNNKIAVGGEVEISRNFLPHFGNDIKFMPTLGVKWVF